MKQLFKVVVAIEITPEGSEALPFGPKNHSNVGEGIFEGRGIGEMRVAEHVSEKIYPAILRPEEESAMLSKSTVESKSLIF